MKRRPGGIQIWKRPFPRVRHPILCILPFWTRGRPRQTRAYDLASRKKTSHGPGTNREGTGKRLIERGGSGRAVARQAGIRGRKGNRLPAKVATELPVLPCRSQHTGSYLLGRFPFVDGGIEIGARPRSHEAAHDGTIKPWDVSTKENLAALPKRMWSSRCRFLRMEGPLPPEQWMEGLHFGICRHDRPFKLHHRL